MVKIIKLTMIINVSDYNGVSKSTKPLYVQVTHIGHICENSEGGTSLGVTTHNNGGFHVKETPEQIIKLIGGSK